MHFFEHLNIWAVLVAGISGFVLGWVYYGPLFGKVWQAEVGLSDEAIRSGAAKTFIPALVLGIIGAITLSILLGDHAGWKAGLHIGLLAGIGIAVVANSTNQLFEKKSFKLILINAGYWVLNMAIMGIIVGAWR